MAASVQGQNQNTQEVKKERLLIIRTRQSSVQILVSNIKIFPKVEDDIPKKTLSTTSTILHLSTFCLISIRFEQESKIYSNEKGSSQETQKGGSSLFNKNTEFHVSDPYHGPFITYTSVPICRLTRERAVSSRLVKQRDGRQSVNVGKNLV